jgi:hypothetical protein
VATLKDVLAMKSDEIKAKWLYYLELLSINLLWIAAVFDPVGDVFGLRYVALVLIFATLLLQILNRRLNFKLDATYLSLHAYFVLALPAYGLFVYYLRGGNGTFIDTSYIGAAVLFFCSLVYLNPESLRIGFAAQRLALRMMAAAIIFFVFIYQVGLPRFLIGFFVENGAAFFGPVRNYGGLKFYYMYFIASPMLIYLVALEAWALFENKTKSQFLWCVLAVLALFLSGTRANIILAICAVPFMFLWRRRGWAAIPIVFMSVSILLWALHFAEVQPISAMFDLQNESSKTKLGLLSAYAEIFSDLVMLFFGQGFNAL